MDRYLINFPYKMDIGPRDNLRNLIYGRRQHASSLSLPLVPSYKQSGCKIWLYYDVCYNMVWETLSVYNIGVAKSDRDERNHTYSAYNEYFKVTKGFYAQETVYHWDCHSIMCWKTVFDPCSIWSNQGAQADFEAISKIDHDLLK